VLLYLALRSELTISLEKVLNGKVDEHSSCKTLQGEPLSALVNVNMMEDVEVNVNMMEGVEHLNNTIEKIIVVKIVFYSGLDTNANSNTYWAR